MRALFSTRREVVRTLVVIGALGTLLRLLACLLDPPIHADEYFQYVEPAWWHLTGVGSTAWEWDEGIRSWVLPFYNGAWLALLMWLGIDESPAIGLALKVHWALVNASLIWLAWRGGSSVCRRLAPPSQVASGSDPPPGHEGGLLAALLCAGFTILVSYSAHTLSELPSMLCLVAGLVLVAELVEQPGESAHIRLWSAATLAGLLLSLGACLRIANGPLTVLGPLWLLLTGRRRTLVELIAGATLPVLLFTSVDRLTWGVWAGSFIEYVKFNFIGDGASDFGVEPARWYFDTLRSRAPFTIYPLLAAALLGARATWPYLLSALGMVAYFSLQPHKEERFVITFWPLLLIAAGGAAGAFIARARRAPGQAPASPRFGSRVRARIAALTRMERAAIATLFAAAVLFDGALHYLGTPRPLSKDQIDGQIWAGKQPSLTGLLVEYPLSTGGYVWFGSRAPMIGGADHADDDALLESPLTSHVLAPAKSRFERKARRAGFVTAREFDSYVVLARAR